MSAQAKVGTSADSEPPADAKPCACADRRGRGDARLARKAFLGAILDWGRQSAAPRWLEETLTAYARGQA